MSNFYAALDGDVDSSPPKKEKKISNAKTIVEPSKPEERRRPQGNNRNTKFGRGGRAPTRDGKRAYDRRSGTGRGKETKKGGGGSHNWGSDKDQVNQQNEETVEEDVPEVEAEAVEPEPEDNTMTVEEFMASKKENSGLLKPVQEREVVNDFANMKVKTSVEEDFCVMGTAKSKRVREAKTAKTVTTGFRVEPPGGSREKDNGGRGGRGGRSRDSVRGGGGRGRGRGGRGGRGGGKGRGVNTMDTKAFPSL